MSATQDNIDDSLSVTGASSGARATGGSLTISGNVLISAILAIGALIAIAVAFQANERSERAMDQARLMERETRILQEDLKFIRAFLSARGIDIPANHEQAEDK